MHLAIIVGLSLGGDLEVLLLWLLNYCVIEIRIDCCLSVKLLVLLLRIL